MAMERIKPRFGQKAIVRQCAALGQEYEPPLFGLLCQNFVVTVAGIEHDPRMLTLFFEEGVHTSIVQGFWSSLRESPSDGYPNSNPNYYHWQTLTVISLSVTLRASCPRTTDLGHTVGC